MSSPICPMPLGEIVRDMLGREKETNPVKRLYDDTFKADIGRWIASCAVIGLSAGIISKHPGHNLLAASAYNLAVVGSLTCIHIKACWPNSGSSSFLCFQDTSQATRTQQPKTANMVYFDSGPFNFNVACCSHCHICSSGRYRCVQWVKSRQAEDGLCWWYIYWNSSNAWQPKHCLWLFWHLCIVSGPLTGLQLWFNIL